MLHFFKFIYILSIFLTCSTSFAIDKGCQYYDVYGSKKLTVDDLCEKYASELNKLRLLIHNGQKESERLDITKTRESLSEKIREDYSLSYVRISTILYSDKEVYITVDIVEKDDVNRRLHFNVLPDINQYVSDSLVDSWIEYEQKGFELFLQDPNNIKFSQCPGFHCLHGFEHPALVIYGEKFTAEVPKHKSRLVEILYKAKNPKKRAAAGYLLAYINDPYELCDILTSSIFDPSSQVRNSVMRVIGSLASQNKLKNFPTEKIVIALNFPDTTDRNKALYVILSLVDQPEYAEYFKLHARNLLVDNLKMKQPNLHKTAYAILNKLGLEFDEYDYVAWEKWAESYTNPKDIIYPILLSKG